MDAFEPVNSGETANSDPSSSSIVATTVRPAKARLPAREARRGSARAADGKSATDRVLRSFNTWAFKREQPDSTDLLRAFIARTIAKYRPVPFVLYWGKGVRRNRAEADIQCLDFLNTLGERISNAYGPGASFTLVFTDTHAELNGYATGETRQYFAEVSQAAEARKFSGCMLSELVAAYGSPRSAAVAAPESLLARLYTCASRRYRSDEPAGVGARKYYEMNMIEKGAVEAAFPDSIFITFNGSDMRPLFPDKLPIFYMYSLKRGTSVKPWYLPALPCPENVETSGPAA